MRVVGLPRASYQAGRLRDTTSAVNAEATAPQRDLCLWRDFRAMGV